MNAKRDDNDNPENKSSDHVLPSPGMFARIRAYFLTASLSVRPLPLLLGLPGGSSNLSTAKSFR